MIKELEKQVIEIQAGAKNEKYQLTTMFSG